MKKMSSYAPIYADYNGSAPLNSAVASYLKERINEGQFANPNTAHPWGKKNLEKMELAREQCATALGARAHQVIFNSGSSEGITQVFHSLLDERNVGSSRNLIITSAIEHSAVFKAAEYYSQRGYQWMVIPVDRDGQINLGHFADLLAIKGQQVALVAIMAANNETGVIQPYGEIASRCQGAHIPFLCDTTQLIGKAPFSFQDSGIDYAVVSGHKVGALIGSGCLLARDKSKLSHLIFGGGQEFGLRGGTQNYIGNETLGLALQESIANLSFLELAKKARSVFESAVKASFHQCQVIGVNRPRSGTTSLLSFEGTPGYLLQKMLEEYGVFVSTSSACSDKKHESSRVLKAMSIPDSLGGAVIRISLGIQDAEKSYAIVWERLKLAFASLHPLEKSLGR